jgi:hypothetical protein
VASTAVVKLFTTVRDNLGRVAKTAIQLALASFDPNTGLGAAWKVIILYFLSTDTKVVKQSTAASGADSHAMTLAPRGNREDKATLDIADVNGVVHSFRIPTPSVSLAPTLGSDKIDPTNANVIAWASAMATNAKTPAGIAFVGTCLGGRYVRHKTEKKGGY